MSDSTWFEDNYQHALVFSVKSSFRSMECLSVGIVIVRVCAYTNLVLEECLFAIPYDGAKPIDSPYTKFQTSSQVRHAFWEVWERWKNRSTMLLTDGVWPEATALFGADFAKVSEIKSTGDFPLFDIQTIRAAAGYNPFRTDLRGLSPDVVENDSLVRAKILSEEFGKLLASFDRGDPNPW